jgi:AraC-like DNA-binding protein
LYTSLLFGFIASVSITLLVASTILHVNFEDIALKQVYRSDLNSLMLKSREVSNMTEIAKSLTYQIYSDSSLLPLQVYSDPSIYEIMLAMRQLNNYRMSLPFIESIYIYNAKTGVFYISSSSVQNGQQTREELDDQQIIQLLDDYEAYPPYTPIPRSYSVGTTKPKEVNVYTYLSYNTLNRLLDYAVVVNIMDSWINRDTTDTSHGPDEQTFIINKHGRLYSNHSEVAMLTDISDREYIRKILADSESGYFEHNIGGSKMLITYTGPDALEWRYVRITPYDQITSEIRAMRMNTVYFSSAILLLGFLISVILSMRLYKPIHTVLHRVHTLENERRNNMQIIRESLLRDYLLGRVEYSPGMLQDQLRSVGSKVRVDGCFMLVLLKIDHYKAALDQYGDDLKLIQYAMSNICLEIAADTYRAEAVNMGEGSIVLLLDADEEIADAGALPDLLKRMQAALTEHLRVSVSCTFSPAVRSIERISEMYRQVVEASMHRLFRGHGCIISSEEIEQLKSKEYEFPTHKEKQLIDLLMMGRAAEARSVYCEIVEETADYSYSVIQLAISHLTMTISNVVNTIKKNNGLDITKDQDITFLSLLNVETIDEINAHFFELFEEVTLRLHQKRNSKHEELIRRIHDIIERDYGDCQLSLNHIAQELDMSPVYISRLYKQLTMKSLTDVIAEVRMSKAKELLLHSDLPIADIAERTGFTNSSYFYRTFKRCNGVTPNEYRRAQFERGGVGG